MAYQYLSLIMIPLLRYFTVNLVDPSLKSFQKVLSIC